MVRYVFLNEAWMVAAWGPDATPEKIAAAQEAARIGASNHPDRVEIVGIWGEDHIEGAVLACRRIIRPPHGRPKLAALEYDPARRHDGRAFPWAVAAQDDAAMTAIMLGDMLVASDMPAKLVKACAVIADTLHPTFARQDWIASPDKSKESCVLASLAVRDFLRRVGFVKAAVRPVVTVMKAWSGERELHSLGIGVPGTPHGPDDRWVGHMVAWVPGSRTLIDTTLYPSARPQWPDLPGMLATTCPPIPKDTPSLDGLVPIIALSQEGDGYEFGITYFDHPGNTGWRAGGDRERQRRHDAVETMVKRFGHWHGKDFST